MVSKLKMVTPTHINHNPVRCMLLHWSKNLKSIPTLKTADKDDEEAGVCNTSGVPNPMVPIPPSISRTSGDTATSRLLATWMSLIPTLQVWPLSQRCTTRTWHRSLLHYEMEPSPWPSLATPLRGKRLRKTDGGLLVSLYQRPVNTAIQASLTRRNHIPDCEEKGTVKPSPHSATWKQN